MFHRKGLQKLKATISGYADRGMKTLRDAIPWSGSNRRKMHDKGIQNSDAGIVTSKRKAKKLVKARTLQA